MKKFKGTPGPWIIEHAIPDHTQVAAFSEEGNRVLCIRPESFRFYEDSHLIAAAPELLDALMELADWYREHTGLPPTAANAAIAKALGEDV